MTEEAHASPAGLWEASSRWRKLCDVERRRNEGSLEAYKAKAARGRAGALTRRRAVCSGHV